MIGYLGAGICADSYGRKRTMTISTVVVIVSSISTSLTFNFGILSYLRFITSIAVSGVIQTGHIIALEMSSTSKLPLCAGFMQLVFITGKLCLSFTAYYVRSWRILQLLISVPAVVMLIYIGWLPESIRWLISKAKFRKARVTIIKAARLNQKEFPDLILQELEKEEIDSENVSDPQEPFGLCTILKTPEIRTWSFTMCFIWVVNSLVYHDVGSNSGNLIQNICISFGLVTASEIPAVLLTIVMMYYVKRRNLTCVLMIVGAVFCSINAFIPQDHPLVCGWISLLGKIFISISYNLIYGYSAELFPTSLRGTTMGIFAMFFHFGGILAPFIFKIQDIYCPLPSIILVGASLFSGILALNLPERQGLQLPENIGECLAFEQTSGLTTLHRPRSYVAVTRSSYTTDERTHLLKHL